MTDFYQKPLSKSCAFHKNIVAKMRSLDSHLISTVFKFSYSRNGF